MTKNLQYGSHMLEGEERFHIYLQHLEPRWHLHAHLSTMNASLYPPSIFQVLFPLATQVGVSTATTQDYKVEQLGLLKLKAFPNFKSSTHFMDETWPVQFVTEV